MVRFIDVSRVQGHQIDSVDPGRLRGSPGIDGLRPCCDQRDPRLGTRRVRRTRRFRDGHPRIAVTHGRYRHHPIAPYRQPRASGTGAQATRRQHSNQRRSDSNEHRCSLHSQDAAHAEAGHSLRRYGPGFQSEELNGYDKWFVRSRPAQLREGLVVSVADLDAIISSKVAAHRPKDQRALPYLESLREQLG